MPALLSRLTALPKLGALKAIIKVLPVSQPLIFIGEGAALRLCNSIADQGYRRVLIVTDDVLNRLGVITPLATTLHGRGVMTTLYDGVRPDPSFEVVEAGLRACRSANADAVLVVGGGSAIDTGKVIALAASTGKSPRQLVGVLKGRRPALPLFVVPSTAGTGSEASIGAVISDSVTHEKALVVDPAMIPLAAALDPRITAGMPAAVTAETGIDALTHALEGWMSEFASPQSDRLNGTAIRLILNNLERACTEPSNLAAREAMALASHYAGICLNTSAIGYVHAIAHQLGACYAVPHGRANAMVLPHVLEFNLPASEPRLARLARTLGLADLRASDAAAADALIQRIRTLLAALPLQLSASMLRSSDYPAIARKALAEAHGMYPVPRYMDEADVYRILAAMQSA
ncbi:MAG: iron-containing alcohol dehydrogenase [Moraxellaceae bacterium]|nr:iron-containing alcohol dehydrogenase [Moraxellaceae bacterium]